MIFRLRHLAIVSLMLLGACSDASFQGDSAHTVRASLLPPAGHLELHLQVTAGEKNIDLAASFALAKNSLTKSATSQVGDYKLINDSVVASDSSGLFPELVAALQATKMSAVVDKTNRQYRVTITLNIPAFNLKDGPVSAQTLIITQTNTELTWSQDNGRTDKFGKLDRQLTTNGCKLEPSGDMPREHVYSVVLTKPAGCDFMLPSLKVGSTGSSSLTTVPVGSYWQGGIAFGYGAVAVAHSFPLNSEYKIFLDNGFILVQPDGKSYLLADGGVARPAAESKRTEEIAKDLSRQLGFGDTTLLKPEPGDALNDYKGGTVFKKGSVIAIYDDTPDMSGTLDVNELVSLAETGGVKFNWSAQVTK